MISNFVCGKENICAYKNCIYAYVLIKEVAHLR